MGSVFDLVLQTTTKIRELLMPLIRKEYPALTDDDIEWAVSLSFKDVDGWVTFMRNYVVPHEQIIQGSEEFAQENKFAAMNGEEVVPVPVLVPGVRLKPVPLPIYKKLNVLLRFYLKLYYVINNGQRAL